MGWDGLLMCDFIWLKVTWQLTHATDNKTCQKYFFLVLQSMADIFKKLLRAAVVGKTKFNDSLP